MFDASETTHVTAALPHFEAALALLANQDLDPVPPVLLGCDIKALRSLIDRLEAQCARRVERFDRDRGYAPSGEGSATNWLRQHCHMSGAAAERHVKFARQLPDLEKTQAALASGQIGIEHALEIARAMARAISRACSMPIWPEASAAWVFSRSGSWRANLTWRSAVAPDM